MCAGSELNFSTPTFTLVAKLFKHEVKTKLQRMSAHKPRYISLFSCEEILH